MTDNSNIAENRNTPDTEEKTFTQEQVNAIVSERLARERAKLESNIVSREQQLQHREFLLEAKETLQAKGLPASLLDALNTSSKEAFEKSLSLIDEHKNTLRPTPPPYASGTGSANLMGGADILRQGFGLDSRLEK